MLEMALRRVLRLNSALLGRRISLAAILFWLTPVSLVHAAPALPSIPSGVFYVTNYGAVADGVSTNTDAFQAAFDDASAHGGGTVAVSGPGTFLCGGSLAMHSNTRFRIDGGTTVKLLPYGQYPGLRGGVAGSQGDEWLVLDRYGHDFELCGPGLLDGQGQAWWNANLDESVRPYEVYLRDASRVFIHDWNSTNPPMKHIVMDGNNYDITVRNTTNSSPDMSPSQNTDCLNLLGTRCLVQDCTFRGCDDNIAMGRSVGACVDILITNVTCGTGHGISFGSILPGGGISNVTVIDCTLSGTENGIRFKCDNDRARGCLMNQVRFLNIGMTNVLRPIIIYSYYNWDGSPDSVTPAIAASTNAAPVTSNTPMWRDILLSNVWGTASSSCKQIGIIWGRTEMLVSNVTLQNINMTTPAGFNVYNARGVRFVDCKFTPSSGSFPTFTMYNAEVTVTNTAFPGLRAVTFDGMTTNANQSSNTLSLFNTQAGLTKTNVLSSQPRLTIGSSVLLVTNHLNLTAASVLNFHLGTNAATIGVRTNLTLAGTINVADGGGLTPGPYTILTYGGSFTWGSPVLGNKPIGAACILDTNTPGQVKLVISSTPPSFNLAALAGTNLVLNTTGGMANATCWLLTSTNLALPLGNWTRVATNRFNASGGLLLTNVPASVWPASFFRLQLP